MKGQVALKEHFAGQFMMGNSVHLADMEGETLAHLRHHYDLLTCENAMKPEALYEGEGRFSFEQADALVSRILEEGFKLHGHVLCWHQQSPSWLWESKEGAPLSREDALANMERHITTVMTHFGDRVISWDVVNEALEGDWLEPENWRRQLRDTGWKRAIGEDYIYQAFKIARATADALGLRTMTLIYNDYNDDQWTKAKAMHAMIEELNGTYRRETGDNRPLISGVGMQGHYNMHTRPSNVRRSLELFGRLGIDIAVTELDLTLLTPGEPSEEELVLQAQKYAAIFAAYRDWAPSISRVTFWGPHDARSWRRDRHPLLFDGDRGIKPAYNAVLDPERWIIDEEVQTMKQAQAIYGTQTDLDWDKEGLDVSSQLTAWEGATAKAIVRYDEDRLYLWINVQDATPDMSGKEPHERDSVEVYIGTGDAVLRYGVDRAGEAFGAPALATLVEPIDTSYLVSFELPRPETETFRFDLQVNDASGGQRIAAATWNDLSGEAYRDAEALGELTLV